MRLLAALSLAAITACQPRQDSTAPDAPEAWRQIEVKNGVAVSILPSSVRARESTTVAWIKAQHANSQELELRGVKFKYDHELNHWSVNCDTFEFSVQKRAFFMGKDKVNEWPSSEIEGMNVETSLATPGTKAYRVVVAMCGSSGNA